MTRAHENLVLELDGRPAMQQLIEHGVDRATAIERVQKLDPQQLVELQGQIEDLPAGAGVSTTDLLLIIILLVLLL